MVLTFFGLAYKICIIQFHPCLFNPTLPFLFHNWQKCSSVFLQNYTICFTTVVTHFVNPRFADTGLFDKISISYSSNPTLLLYFLLLPQFSSVQSLSHVRLCDPMNRSTPGLPVHHQLQEFTQTYVHRVSNAIQPSYPLSSPSPPAPNPSQHQSLFQWVNSSHEVAKVLEFQL